MSYNTVQNLISDLKRRVKCDESSDIYSLVNEAIRIMLSKVDPLETKRVAYLEYGVFRNISRYFVPDDLKNKRIIDIRRQDYRTFLSDFAQTSERTFDKYYSTSPELARNHFTIEHVNGRRYLRFSDSHLGCTYPLINCNSLDNWNVYGSINNLTLDKLNFIQKNASLRFDIDSNTFGAIEYISPTSTSIERFKQVGSILTALYLNKFNVIQSITLKLGSSATDYYTIKITSPHDYIDFVNKWQDIKFSLDKMQVTGTPIDSQITRFRLEFETNGTPIYDIRLDNISLYIATLFELKYYSDWIVQNAQTYDFKEKVESLDDLIVLDSDGYEILLLECAILLAKEVRKDIQEVQLLISDLKSAYDNFKVDHKSEYEKPVEYWYKKQNVDSFYGNYHGGFYGGYNY